MLNVNYIAIKINFLKKCICLGRRLPVTSEPWRFQAWTLWGQEFRGNGLTSGLQSGLGFRDMIDLPGNSGRTLVQSVCIFSSLGAFANVNVPHTLWICPPKNTFLLYCTEHFFKLLICSFILRERGLTRGSISRPWYRDLSRNREWVA